MNTKYFVFAWCEHEAFGGMGDFQKACDTFEEAELSLPSLDTKNAPFGYWEVAAVVAVNHDFSWETKAEFVNMDNKGWKLWVEWR